MIRTSINRRLAGFRSTRRHRSDLPEADADAAEHRTHLALEAARFGQLALQRLHLGDHRPELLVPIGGRNGCSVPDGLGTELLVLRPEPIHAPPAPLPLR